MLESYESSFRQNFGQVLSPRINSTTPDVKKNYSKPANPSPILFNSIN